MGVRPFVAPRVPSVNSCVEEILWLPIMPLGPNLSSRIHDNAAHANRIALNRRRTELPKSESPALVHAHCDRNTIARKTINRMAISKNRTLVSRNPFRNSNENRCWAIVCCRSIPGGNGIGTALRTRLHRFDHHSTRRVSLLHGPTARMQRSPFRKTRGTCLYICVWTQSISSFMIMCDLPVSVRSKAEPGYGSP